MALIDNLDFTLTAEEMLEVADTMELMLKDLEEGTASQCEFFTQEQIEEQIDRYKMGIENVKRKANQQKLRELDL